MNPRTFQQISDMKPLRSISLRPDGVDPPMLPPLMEIPTLEDFAAYGKTTKVRPWTSVKIWMRDHLEKASQPLSGYVKRSDVQLLLGVLGSPLAPAPVKTGQPLPQISVKDNPIGTSSAQYIVHQYIAATGGSKLQSSINNFYAMGKVKMVASEFEAASKVVRTRNPTKAAEGGCFVLWQMMPDMWCIELSLAGCKVRAGSNGKLVWRHTPWIGSHRVKGPVRPLRRALQGLDPWTTGNMFSQARCVGEKTIDGDECFVLKLVADPATLHARSDGPAEIIRHVMFGYFSQKTGFLVHLEDSHLLRIQSTGPDTVYWETSMESWLEDYRPVDGVCIPHAGRTVLTLFRFGETAMSHTKTRLEETWVIEEVAFNVPGLSAESFIPPADLGEGTVFSEASELTVEERGKSVQVVNHGRSKVAALEKANSLETMDELLCKAGAHGQRATDHSF